MGDRDSSSGRASYRVNRLALAQTKQQIREKNIIFKSTKNILWEGAAMLDLSEFSQSACFILCGWPSIYVCSSATPLAMFK